MHHPSDGIIRPHFSLISSAKSASKGLHRPGDGTLHLHFSRAILVVTRAMNAFARTSHLVAIAPHFSQAIESDDLHQLDDGIHSFKCTFVYGSMSNYGNYFFSDTEEQMFPTTKSYSPFRDCDDVDCDHLLDDMEAMPQFQEDNDPRQNQPITPRSHSRIRLKYQL
ncbi:hypothetical protein WN944_014282 [Citrus x changshan-huyou]|uniref:Uncharacterized protein n=1 Tax=Citrus x changshan-huyou TaxID=2935761 RepID=A0AAP0MBV7_9ROSI